MATILPINPEALSRSDAASTLGISVRSIDYLCSSKFGPARMRTRRRGRRVLIPVSEIARIGRMDLGRIRPVSITAAIFTAQAVR